jgi:acyl carrier protein
MTPEAANAQKALVSDTAPWVARLAAAGPDRTTALAQLLRGEIAETMGFDDVASVPQDRDFFDLGMDSLMMAELVGRLKKQCGVSVSDLVFDYPNVNALAARLIERIPVAAATEPPAAAPAPPPAPAARALDGMSGYRKDDDAEIFAFQQLAWPHRSSELIEPRWRWLFADSAARLGAEPQVWLYRDEGALVGHMAAIPVRLKIGGGVHDTAWLADTMVLEPYRKKAVGSRLMVQAHDDLPFALSLGQTAEMREIQYRLGWKNVAPLQTAQLVIRPENVLQGKVPKPAAVAAGWGLRAASAVRDLMRAERVPVREIDRFCERHDALWQQMAASVGCAVVRDASYMNWKYVDQPGQEFVRLDVLDGGTLIGAAVLAFREPDQVYAYRRALLLDIVAPLTHRRALSQVLQAAARAAAARGADALWCLHTGADLSKALRHEGFVFRKPERFLLVDPGISGSAREQVLSPDAWFLTQGDSDVDRPW